jgi:NADP-dependent 3-hydroxy acid dehydrogenase YdfG
MRNGRRMDQSTDGKTPVALVTGASYGVGAAVALALAEAGYDLVLTALHADRLAATVGRVNATGRRVLALQLDLAAPDAMCELVANAVEKLGYIDVLVNNAAVNLRRRALDVTQADWASVTGAARSSISRRCTD